jgi:hypothetical protein
VSIHAGELLHIFIIDMIKRNGPDFVQAFPKKLWIESDFMAPNLSFPLWLEGSDCHYYSIFNNTGTHHTGQRDKHKTLKTKIMNNKDLTSNWGCT